MNPYILCLTLIGIASLAMAWMPALTKKLKISYAIVYVLAGVILFSVLPALPRPDPLRYPELTLHLTELVVIVSIMGTGLKIDEPFSLKTWAVPLRLVTVTMFCAIVVVAWIGWYFFNLPLATAILLGAVLAPTDPVLASDVQTGPPMDREKDNTKFTLTAEAGMNDGMAFPFTWLAIALATATGSRQEALFHWVGLDVFYRIAAGVGIGFIVGKLLAYVLLAPKHKATVVIRDGFVGVSATLLVYGLTELIHGYGFIAVFVTAITLRNSKMRHRFHKELYDFTDQVEKIFVAIVLLLLGGALVSGILKPLTLGWGIFGILFLLLIRPLTALLSMIRSPLHRKEKAAISFFGIRGMGSFFYLAFALQEASFSHAAQLWAVVAFIVLISIVIHGLSAATVIQSIAGKYPHIEELTQQEESKKEG